MIGDGEDIPVPDDLEGEIVYLPTLTALKVNLYWALRASDITRAELSRRLGWNCNSVDRLFLLDHKSRLEQLEAAFAALNRTIDVEIHVAA